MYYWQSELPHDKSYDIAFMSELFSCQKHRGTFTLWKWYLQTLCIYVFLLIPSIAIALPTDQHQPATIHANHAQFNIKTGKGVFMGDVVIIQGSTKLMAHKLTLYSNKNHKLTKAIARGQPARYQTLPQKGKPLLHANADTIEYFPQQNKVILIGHGELSQNKNRFTGNYIIYNQKTNRLISKPYHHGRTTIVLQPNRLPQLLKGNAS